MGESSTTDVPPPSSFTDVPPPSSFTDVPPPSSSTDVPPPSSSTDVPPPSSSTDVPPPSSSTDVPPPSSSTDVPPPSSSTDVPPPSSSTDVPPPPSSADVAPPPSQKVLVPPMFDYRPLAIRNSTMESMYNMLFGKMALRSLFDSYLEGANRFSTRMILLELDSLSDFIFTVTAPLDQNSEEGVVGNAEFRLKSVGMHSEAKLDICVSNTEPTLQMRSSIYFPELRMAVFWKSSPIFNREMLLHSKLFSGDAGIIGITSGCGFAFTGATFTHNMHKVSPQTAWFVSKIGVLTAGVQYEPKFKSEGVAPQRNLENWSFAISYGRHIDSPFTPSFNFALQFANNSQFIASFYQHMVVQRPVINPFEKEKVVRITNYIDFGVELQTRMDKYRNKIRDSTFQFVASWQASKNLLVKGKVGPLSSSIALVFKSWWKPSLTFNISAVRDPTKGATSFGFGFQVDSKRAPSYQMAHSDDVMFTPNQVYSF